MRSEFKMTHELILIQLQSLMARSNGGSIGESSKATPLNPQMPEGMNPNSVPNFKNQDCGQQYLQQPRPPFLKKDFPRFNDGDDPLGWIIKA